MVRKQIEEYEKWGLVINMHKTKYESRFLKGRNIFVEMKKTAQKSILLHKIYFWQ